MKIFLNFKQPRYIWIQKLFQWLIWMNYQNCKKIYLLKTLETSNYSKIPPFLQIFVHSVSVFSLRPDVFLARYSVFCLKWKTYFRSFTARTLSLGLNWWKGKPKGVGETHTCLVQNARQIQFWIRVSFSCLACQNAYLAYK